MQRAAGKGVLHDGEADQQDDQDQPAAERRLHDVVVEHAGDRHPRADQPDQHHHPARHQHDGAVVALDAEIDDQPDADDRRAGEREPRDAGRDRRIEHRDAGDQDQAGDPHQRAVAEMAVPAVEVEIGEQEHHERRAKPDLGSGAPYLLAVRAISPRPC